MSDQGSNPIVIRIVAGLAAAWGMSHFATENDSREAHAVIGKECDNIVSKLSPELLGAAKGSLSHFRYAPLRGRAVAGIVLYVPPTPSAQSVAEAGIHLTWLRPSVRRC